MFLPLSFIVGFFGQNFKWMVENVGSAAAFFGLGIGSLLLSVVALLYLVPPRLLSLSGGARNPV